MMSASAESLAFKLSWIFMPLWDFGYFDLLLHPFYYIFFSVFLVNFLLGWLPWGRKRGGAMEKVLATEKTGKLIILGPLRDVYIMIW